MEESKKTTRSKLFLLSFLAIASTYLLGAWLVETDSYVYNENARLTAGLINILKQDYSVFSVNPPLSSVVAALPSALIPGVYCPYKMDYGFREHRRYEDEAGRVFLEKNPNGRNLVRLGRYSVLLFSAFGLLVCFLYGSWLFGTAGGAVAGVLWLFSPYILGHGAHIGPDVPSAAMALAASASFHYALASNSEKWLTRSGVALGLAESTKFTLIILYPILILLAIVYRLPTWRKQTRKENLSETCRAFLLWFALSLVVVNSCYLFKGSFKPLGSFQFKSQLFSGKKTGELGNRFQNSWLGVAPVPLPADYLEGIDVQRVDFETGLNGTSYLNGRWSARGWFRYYFYALLIKTPLGFLALLALAIALTTRPQFCSPLRDEAFLWTPGLATLLFVSSQTGFSVHSRYAIPALPFFFVATARVGLLFSKKFASFNAPRVKMIRTLVAILISLGVLSVLSVYPHEISYFNSLPLAMKSPAPKLLDPVPRGAKEKYEAIALKSSREGARFLLGSNIDWGQDSRRLGVWLEGRRDVDELYVRLISSEPLEELPVPCRIYSPRLKPGFYALGVNDLYEEGGFYSDFFKLRPEAVIGATIYVFRVGEKEAEQMTFRETDGQEAAR